MPEAIGLYYEEHGPRDAPPLILSAGLGGAGAYWQPNLAALAERHRVVTYDLAAPAAATARCPKA